MVLLDLVEPGIVRRLARYAGVSVISTATSLGILALLVATNTVSPGWANVIATAIGTIPSFELNRRWVWSKPGKRSLLTEVGPFCALSFLSLGLSTVTVSAATGYATAHHMGDAARTLYATGASILTFGSMWVVQYLVLDRLLFRRSTPRTY